MLLRLALAVEEVVPVEAALGQARVAGPADLDEPEAAQPRQGAGAVLAHRRRIRVRSLFLSMLGTSVVGVEVDEGAVPLHGVVVGAVLKPREVGAAGKAAFEFLTLVLAGRLLTASAAPHHGSGVSPMIRLGGTATPTPSTAARRPGPGRWGLTVHPQASKEGFACQATPSRPPCSSHDLGSAA
jgi:hypothetical protein